MAVSTVVGLAPPAVADPQPGVGQYFPSRHRVASNTSIAAGGTATITVAGAPGLPLGGLGAVALNVSGKGDSAAGGLIVYPSDAAQPNAVALRYRSGAFSHNMVLAKVGEDGKIKVTNTGSAGVKINLDALGYTPSGIGTSLGSTYVALNPAQILTDQSVGSLGNHSLTVLGQGGVPASGVEAVALNIRASSNSSGAIRVHAAGEVLPLDATLDYASGKAAHNSTVVKLGTDGKVNIHNQGLFQAKVWVDVAGYFTKSDPDGPTFRALQPANLVTDVSIPAGGTHTFAPAGQAGHPATGVEAISLGVDVQSAAAGTIRVYPAGVFDPGNDTAGFNAGIAATGSALTKLGADGQIVLKNTGTAAATVSVATYGYFRSGLSFSEVTAGPGDGSWANSARVNSTTPTLSATGSSIAADPITYTFQVADMLSDAPLAEGTVASTPAGDPATWTVPAGIMANPGSYRFRVRAADGSDSIWSSWRWLFVDAPDIPSDLTVHLDDPESPMLSGTVSRPSGDMVNGRFHLFDGSGQPLGGGVLGEGSVKGGQRLNIQVPEELITAGQTYQWQMDACVGSACSTRTPMQSFTAPAVPQPPATQSIALDADDITIRAAKTGATACSGGPCPLAEGTAVKVGGSGDNAWASVLELDLSSLPAGARATNATISLGQPSCSTACPSSGGTLITRQPRQAWTEGPTGAEALEIGHAEPLAESPVSPASLPIGDLVSGWQEGPAFADGIILQTEGDSLPDIVYAEADISVTVDYLPATAPGKVAHVAALGGDTKAMITWAAPADEGAARAPSDGEAPGVSAVTGYQVQELDASDQVLRTLTSEDTRLVVDGLTNDTAHRFRVRAESVHGQGPWSDVQIATPHSVVGGATRFVDAAEQYLTSKDAFMEGDLNSLLEVMANYPQAELFGSLLSTQIDRLIQIRETIAEDDLVQVSSEFTFPELFVAYSPEKNEVRVRTKSEGTTVYRTDPGLPTEAETTSEFSREGDFVFEVPSGSADPVLTAVITGTVSATPEVNAFPPDQPAVAPDDSVLPDTTAAAPGATSFAAAEVDNSGIATWAKKYLKTKHEYPNDCANFVSKAMRYGGKARYIQPGYYYRISHPFWYKEIKYWRQDWPKDTWSWSSARYNWEHFSVKHNRISWRPDYASVRVGDIVYFRHPDWKGQVGHLAVVTKKESNRPSGIKYSHHSNGESVPDKAFSLALADGYTAGFGRVLW